jgi:DNA repair photolyase
VRRASTTFKGRGAGFNPPNRFESVTRVADDEAYWEPDDSAPATQVVLQRAKSIISRNDSPDIPFTQSINPYQGCEHGCVYCYARPSHAYLGLSPGLDFETRLFAKINAADLLRAELSRPGYRCEVITVGANTDPYQPIERDHRITRGIIAALGDFRHPLGIVTKSALVERDIDLLAPMATQNLVQVFVSVTTLDRELARKLEPRASAPYRRLTAIRRLAEAGVPCGVLVAPVIPFVNDKDIEAILAAAGDAGARWAGTILLRLPHELKALFKDWLGRHYPLRAAHVMARIRDVRGGRENDPEFGSRMTGTGQFAQLLRQRFDKACARLGLNRDGRYELDTTRFRVPGRGEQLGLL